MHHYQFNIGDYKKDTAHLSILEHGIYRMLIDSYYTNEGPLEADDAKLMRTHCVRSADEQQAYKNVIADFFEVVDGCYRHEGCDKVLAKIYEKSDKARESAAKRWASKNKDLANHKCDKDANAVRTHSESNANGMLPITHNPLPIKKKPAAKASAVSLDDYIKANENEDEGIIPITDPIFVYAEQVKLPPEYLSLCWNSFVAKHSGGKKKYADWRAAFRNAVKGNWEKLWWIDAEGTYQLTTAGKQAQKLQESQS